MIKYSATLAAYGLVIFLSGLVTYLVSPDRGSAFTAVAVSGGIAVLAFACAVGSPTVKSNRMVGMIAIHLGLVLPLLGILGPAMRLAPSYANARVAAAQVQEINADLEANERAVIGRLSEPGATPAGLEEEGVTVVLSEGQDFKPVGYQTVGIASSGLISALAFVALVLHRPKVPKKEEGERGEREPVTTRENRGV